MQTFWMLRRAAARHLPAAPPPATLLGPSGEHLDPAVLLDRRGERLWLLADPAVPALSPLPWLLTAAWRRLAADPRNAQRPVPLDLAGRSTERLITTEYLLE